MVPSGVPAFVASRAAWLGPGCRLQGTGQRATPALLAPSTPPDRRHYGALAALAGGLDLVGAYATLLRRQRAGRQRRCATFARVDLVSELDRPQTEGIMTARLAHEVRRACLLVYSELAEAIVRSQKQEAAAAWYVHSNKPTRPRRPRSVSAQACGGARHAESVQDAPRLKGGFRIIASWAAMFPWRVNQE